MDGLRYCRTPIYKDKERPQGVGAVENIELSNITVYATARRPKQGLLVFETHADSFRITNFKRDLGKDRCPGRPAITAKNLLNTRINIDGKEHILSKKKDKLVFRKSFESLEINRC